MGVPGKNHSGWINRDDASGNQCGSPLWLRCESSTALEIPWCPRQASNLHCAAFKAVPLPVGLRRLGVRTRIRTAIARRLKAPPLPIGLHGHCRDIAYAMKLQCLVLYDGFEPPSHGI